MFILPNEYKAIIQEQILDLSIESDTALISQIEQAVAAEMRGYLNARYDCDKIFIQIGVWSFYATYPMGSLVINPITGGGIIYSALLAFASGDEPPAIWSDTETYASNALAYLNDNTNNAGTYLNTSGSTLTGTPPPQPGWTRSIDVWMPHDPRNPIVLLHFKNMVIYHLSMRINQRNIPEQRLLAYQRAIKWLEGVQAEKINPELPKYSNATFDTPNDHRYVFNSKGYRSTRW